MGQRPSTTLAKSEGTHRNTGGHGPNRERVKVIQGKRRGPKRSRHPGASKWNILGSTQWILTRRPTIGGCPSGKGRDQVVKWWGPGNGKTAPPGVRGLSRGPRTRDHPSHDIIGEDSVSACRGSERYMTRKAGKTYSTFVFRQITGTRARSLNSITMKVRKRRQF